MGHLKLDLERLTVGIIVVVDHILHVVGEAGHMREDSVQMILTGHNPIEVKAKQLTSSPKKKIDNDNKKQPLLASLLKESWWIPTKNSFTVSLGTIVTVAGATFFSSVLRFHTIRWIALEKVLGSLYFSFSHSPRFFSLHTLVHRLCLAS